MSERDSLKNWKKGFGANILAVIIAHIPCCGSQLLIGVIGAHSVAALSGGFFHGLELVVPLLAASIITAYMLFLLRSEKKKHACCGTHSAENHKDHQGRLKDIALFFVVNLIIGYAISFGVHELLHDHAH